jgi:adenylate kinase
VLPPEVLLSDEKIAAIKAEQAEITLRRAKDKAKDEEERKKKAARDAGSYTPPLF